eukprot:scaffold281584_cov34-Prasinocladus_malaysianus.AAC.1
MLAVTTFAAAITDVVKCIIVIAFIIAIDMIVDAFLYTGVTAISKCFLAEGPHCLCATGDPSDSLLDRAVHPPVVVPHLPACDGCLGGGGGQAPGGPLGAVPQADAHPVRQPWPGRRRPCGGRRSGPAVSGGAHCRRIPVLELHAFAFPSPTSPGVGSAGFGAPAWDWPIHVSI